MITLSKLVLTFEDFTPLGAGWNPTPADIEQRRRIQIAVATYAYEIADRPIMGDAQWDILAARINRRQGTCSPELDHFFVAEFSPMTGMWIHNHPELAGIKRIYDRVFGSPAR